MKSQAAAQDALKSVEAPISRRIAIGRVAFFGAAMSAIASPGCVLAARDPLPQY